MIKNREAGVTEKSTTRSGVGLVAHPRFAESAVRVAASLGAYCAITVTALVMLGSQSGDGPVLWHCAMMTGIAFLGLVVVFADRTKVTAKAKRQPQTGIARAGSQRQAAGPARTAA